MKALFLSVVAIGLVISLPVSAQDANPMRGDELARMCKEAANLSDPSVTKPTDTAGAMLYSWEAGYCLGYLSGFIGGKGLGKDPKAEPMLACVPPDATTEQLARVVAKANDDHPEYGNMPALAFAAGSLAGAWPCRK